MDRIAALVEKELHHHGAMLLSLSVVLPLAYLITIVGVVFSPQNITILTTHQVFLWVFVPLSALLLGHRLVVVEYHGRTQLFVEALPIRRTEMVGVKYCFGLAIVLVIAALSLALSAWVASYREPVGARFLGLMMIRTAAFAYCLWSTFFAMGFLGRFRVPIYVGFFILLFALDMLTELELGRFGPFAMVDEQLVLERESPPSGTAFATTLILGTAWVGLGLGLALMNEGSVAEALARRMTLREKAIVGILFVAGMAATTVLDSRKEQAPFSFQEQEVLRSARIPLEILYLSESALADAEALREQLEVDLGDLEQALFGSHGQPSKLPAVRIALRESLDAVTFEPVGLAKNDGVLVRANFRKSAPWDGGGSRAFRAFLIREVLSELTSGRAEFEPKAWIHDGLSRYWADRDQLDTCRRAPGSCLPLLRAVWATRDGRAVDARRLSRWFRYREQNGEDIAWSVAFSGMLVLEERHGHDAVIALARALYARPTPIDIREVIHERSNRLPSVFEQAVGTPLGELIVEWNAELDRLRLLPEVAVVVDAVPEATGKLTIERDVGAIRNAVVRLDLRSPLPPREPGSRGGVVSLLHRDIPPFDSVIALHELRREQSLIGSGETTTEIRLLGRYGPGMRVFFALDLESRALGCPLRVLAERRQIR